MSNSSIHNNLESKTIESDEPGAAPVAPTMTAPTRDWQSISTAPKDIEVFFWIVPRTADESYTDTSGRPITASFTPYLLKGKHGWWSALAKATHWMPLPAGPGAAPVTPPMLSEQDRVHLIGLLDDHLAHCGNAGELYPARIEAIKAWIRAASVAAAGPQDAAKDLELAKLSNENQQLREEIQRLRGLLIAQMPEHAPAPEPDGLDAFPSESK